MPKTFRQRKISSSSSEDEASKKTEELDSDNVKDKIEEIKFLQKLRNRSHGLDVYSLAIGESDSSSSALLKNLEGDPWKSKTGGLVDMNVLLEKRGNEIVKNMQITFSKETNQRDEDAEMQRLIEEQVKKKKDSDRKDGLYETMESECEIKKFKLPQDALFDVPKYLLESNSRLKSDGILSEQMVSGIPEVDLGIQEKIRNIEETEKAKQQIESKTSKVVSTRKQTNQNSSVNYVQHKRFDESVLVDKNRPPVQKDKKPIIEEPVVGDAPKHELLQAQKRKETDNKTKDTNNETKKQKNAPGEKASDEYCLEKFKKNIKFNRGNKIKIA